MERLLPRTAQVRLATLQAVAEVTTRPEVVGRSETNYLSTMKPLARGFAVSGVGALLGSFGYT